MQTHVHGAPRSIDTQLSSEPTAAAAAFDAIANIFDSRYGTWRSVTAQRDAVRVVLRRTFAPDAHVLEIGGGTGEDAKWLLEKGRHVFMTDAAPSMVDVARAKLRMYPYAQTAVVAAESLEAFAHERLTNGEALFDGIFSNFAALNCVADLTPVAQGLAKLVRPGGQVILVLFGPYAPGEIVTQVVRGDYRAAFRRRARGYVPARLGGRTFTVRYHRPRTIVSAMEPWFRPVAQRGIGVFVPPSAAEPWISNHPRLLHALATLDRAVSRPLALLGDHILYQFERRADTLETPRNLA